MREPDRFYTMAVETAAQLKGASVQELQAVLDDEEEGVELRLEVAIIAGALRVAADGGYTQGEEPVEQTLPSTGASGAARAPQKADEKTAGDAVASDGATAETPG